MYLASAVKCRLLYEVKIIPKGAYNGYPLIITYRNKTFVFKHDPTDDDILCRLNQKDNTGPYSMQRMFDEFVIRRRTYYKTSYVDHQGFKTSISTSHPPTVQDLSGKISSRILGFLKHQAGDTTFNRIKSCINHVKLDQLIEQDICYDCNLQRSVPSPAIPIS